MRTRANYGVVGVVQSVTGSNTGIVASSVDHIYALKTSNWVGFPGAPTSVTATGISKGATVSFTAPASNGGTAITGYTITSNPGNKTVTTTTTSGTVTGLTNGTSYTFTVIATNAKGNSTPSTASSSIIPNIVPDRYLMTTQEWVPAHATFLHPFKGEDPGYHGSPESQQYLADIYYKVITEWQD